MKKLIVITTLLTAGLFSQAQVKFGIKAGANFFRFTGDDAFDGVSSKLRVGLAAGGLVQIPINETFSVQPELLYSMEGAKFKEDGEKAIFKNDYIKVPVMFQYNASGFYAETGPQIGFLVSAKLSDGDNDVDYKDNLKSTAFAWTVGLGYRLTSGIAVGARYDIGLSSISDSGDEKIKNSGFHVGLSYLFK